MKLATMLKSKLFIGCAAGVTAAAAAVAAVIVLNQPQTYRSIKVAEVDGHASVQRSVSETLDAYSGMNLQNGDIISTGGESSLQASLDSDKYILLDENTVIELEASGTEQDSRSLITLKQGSILNEITKKLSADSSYEISTPKAVMAVRGTSFAVELVKQNDGSYISVLRTFHGKVEVQLIDENGNPKGTPVTVGENSSVAIKTDPGTSGSAVTDGNSYFVIYDKETDTYIPVGASENPVTETDYYDVSVPLLRRIVESDNAGKLNINENIIVRILEVLNGTPEATTTKAPVAVVTDTSSEESETTTTTNAEITTVPVGTTSVTTVPTTTTAPETAAPVTVTTAATTEVTTTTTEATTTTEETTTTTEKTTTSAAATTVRTVTATAPVTAITTVPAVTTTTESTTTTEGTTATTEEPEEETEVEISVFDTDGNSLTTLTKEIGSTITVAELENLTGAKIKGIKTSQNGALLESYTVSEAAAAIYVELIREVTVTVRIYKSVYEPEYDVISYSVTDTVYEIGDVVYLMDFPQFTDNGVTYAPCIWDDGTSGGIEITESVTELIMLYEPLYTVTFVDQNGDVVATDYVYHGRAATAPTAEEIPNCITGGVEYYWELWIDSYSNVTSNLEIRGSYRVATTEYELLLVKDGEAYQHTKHYIGNTVALPTLADVGNLHEGWFNATSGFEGVDIIGGSMESALSPQYVASTPTTSIRITAHARFLARKYVKQNVYIGDDMHTLSSSYVLEGGSFSAPSVSLGYYQSLYPDTPDAVMIMYKINSDGTRTQIAGIAGLTPENTGDLNIVIYYS